MSNKSNCNFKKNKYTNAHMSNQKNNETSMNTTKDHLPKTKINYNKKSDATPCFVFPSENIVCLKNENFLHDKKNFDIVLEDSPKVTKKSSNDPVTSSSNLPTANNSFHTAISSPEQDKFQEEYQYISYNRNKKTNGKLRNRKISSAESDLDSLEFGEMNCLSGVMAANNKKKSDDFKVKFKTEMCKFWELDKICKYGDNCAFAHGISEMRIKSEITTHYRTKKCKQFFENGFCTYGNRCQFAHAEKKQNNFSYYKFLKLISSGKKTDAIISFNNNNVNHHRLPIFEKIFKIDKKTAELNKFNSFLDDVKKFFHFNEDNSYKNCNDGQYVNDTYAQRSRLLSL